MTNIVPDIKAKDVAEVIVDKLNRDFKLNLSPEQTYIVAVSISDIIEEYVDDKYGEHECSNCGGTFELEVECIRRCATYRR